MTTQPDTWSEFVLVDIMPEGGSNYRFGALIEDISAMDWGEKDIEGKVMINGGRRVATKPMTDESISMKLFSVGHDLDEGMLQHFHPQGTADSTDPIVVQNTNNRKRFRIIILQSTKILSMGGATSIPPASEPSERIQIINAYLTKCKPSMDDKVKSWEVTFKWAPFNSSGTGNKKEESTPTTVLAAITTSATSFT